MLAHAAVMFGSDYPCWDPARGLQTLQETGLEPATLAAIRDANARRLFGLGEDS